MDLRVRRDTSLARRAAILEAWFRSQVREEGSRLLARWEKRLGVRAGKIGVRAMRTRWGGCNPKTGFIRLNTDLARKPGECLEYILVHELLHLRAPVHDARFQALLNRYLPGWLHRRELLNRLPLRRESWDYSDRHQARLPGSQAL